LEKGIEYSMTGQLGAVEPATSDRGIGSVNAQARHET